MPGPPLSFRSYNAASDTLCQVLFNSADHFAVITIVVTILDYIVPIWGTKIRRIKIRNKGATVGLIIGLFLGPVGIIVRPFIGAIVGELIFKDDMKYTVKAGFGSLLGSLPA